MQVTRNLNDLSLLVALMRVVQSLLRNPHIHIEPYVSFKKLWHIFFVQWKKSMSINRASKQAEKYVKSHYKNIRFT